MGQPELQYTKYTRTGIKTRFCDEFDLLKNVVCNHQRELIGMGKT